MSWYIVRLARRDDFDDIVEIEAEGFPEGQAATKEMLEDRYRHFQRHIYVIEYAGMVIGFINGMVTDKEVVTADMFKDASLHNEEGEWQTIFGFSIRKAYRGRGYAEKLMERFIYAATKEDRKGLIAVCSKEMMPFYEKLGFTLKSESKDLFGGETWYDMCRECKKKRKHNYTSKIYTEENRI